MSLGKHQIQIDLLDLHLDVEFDNNYPYFIISDDPVFKLLLSVHNTVQRVQCFQCPPQALCTDARDLVQECMISLQQSQLSEAAEILDILNKIEFEGLFYSHDKLAQLQVLNKWCWSEVGRYFSPNK